MGINDYKENLERNDPIYNMDLKELRIEEKRLKDLISTYDSWGSAQSINTDKYHKVKRILRSHLVTCGKCGNRQYMEKINYGVKPSEFSYWCPNCKDQISPSACKA